MANQGNSLKDSNGPRWLQADRPSVTRVAEADAMRIELLRCAPNSTIQWHIPAAGLALVWASNFGGSPQIRVGGGTAPLTSGNLCFFPDGQDADGVITVGGEADCVSIFLDPVAVPIQLHETLRAPLVGFSHDELGRAFRTLARELATPDEIFVVLSQGLVLQALAYVARLTARTEARRRPSGLAPWQLRKAQQAIRADLASPPALRELAQACRLSLGHFSRAFKASTGVAPHTWLTQARVEHAQTMMRDAGARLADIAVECGFADQSHLTRCFVRHVGISPGAWRRNCEECAVG